MSTFVSRATMLAAALLLATGGFWLGRFTSHGTDPSSTAPASERKVLYWHDPMVPGHRFDKPGKSPFMDMQLVPVYADESGNLGDSGVTVSPAMQQSLGIRTAIVKRAEPKSLRLVVPAEAVIRTGRRVVVIVRKEDGRFESRDVSIGQELGEDIEVLQGLNEGEQVVASGQFLIDSEARLRSAGLGGPK